MTSEIVKIFVGPSRKKYNLHKAFLCDRSSFFNGVFESNFQESRKKVMNLPEDSTEAFEIFTRWIYGNPLARVTHDDELPAHIQLYALAENAEWRIG